MKSFSTSARLSAEVGSSMTMSRELHRKRPRDLDHLLLGDRELAHQRHRVVRRDRCDRVMARVLAAMRRQLTNDLSPGSRPMKTFSAIVMLGARVNSW